MIGVVIDTNIVFSAMIKSGGLPEAVFKLAVDRVRLQLYYSAAVMNEYEDVLHRPRLDVHAEKVTGALARIREAGLIVAPTESVTAAPTLTTTSS